MAVTQDEKFSGLDLVGTPLPSDEFGCNQGGVSFKQTRLQLHTLQTGESYDTAPGIPQSIKAEGVDGIRLINTGGGILQSRQANTGLTADVGSDQGDGVITSTYNVYSVVANAGDAATLPAVFEIDTIVYVKNDGANSMDVFPAVGDNAGAGANVAIAVASGESAVFIATSANAVWTQLLSSGGASFPLLAPNGTVGAPSYSFADQTNTGIYRPAANQVGVSANGFEVVRFQAPGSTSKQIIIPLQNNQGAPSLAFGDGDTGFMEQSDDFLAVVISGTNRWRWSDADFRSQTSGGPVIKRTAATLTDPSIVASTNDTNTGIGSANDEFIAVAGGVTALRLVELNSGVVQAPFATLGITAFATGGQGSATALVASYNVLGTVASSGDSVRLPDVFNVNSLVYVKNDGASAADIFPASGDDLGAGTDTAVSVPSGESKVFIATVANATWTELLPSASGGGGDVTKVGTPVDDQIGIWTGDGTLEGTDAFKVVSGILVFTGTEFRLTGDLTLQGSNRPAVIDESSSNTNPVLIPLATTPTTGIGGQGTSLSLISSSLSGMNLTALSGGVLRAYQTSATLTAFAGGGQGSATQIINSNNIVTTVATTGDSVKLPITSNLGAVFFIKNDGANALDVFPDSGGDLGAGTNTAISLPAGASVSYVTTDSSTFTPWIVAAPASLTAIAAGSAGAPSLAWGDGDSGFYEESDDTIALSILGTQQFKFLGSQFNTSLAGGGIRNVVSTGSTPSLLPKHSDTNTGIGNDGADTLTLISGGVEWLRGIEGGGQVTITLTGNANLAATKHFIVPQTNEPATPTIAFGDGNTGFFESVDNTLKASVGGLATFQWVGDQFRSESSTGAAIFNEAVSATNPTICPNVSDSDTGLGQGTADQLDLLAGALSCMAVRNVASARQIGFYTTTPISQQTGVAVTAGAIHAALVALGLITA